MLTNQGYSWIIKFWHIWNDSYLPSPDDVLALDIAYTIYIKFDDLASALRIALHLDNIQVFIIGHCSTLSSNSSS